MRRRILAILVTALMVFQTIPTTAFAADTAAEMTSQIGGYYEVDDATGAIPDDTALDAATPNSYEDGAVTVNKSIEATDQENVFNVKLEVSTTETVNSETASPDAAVVLVLDASRSMRTCAVCNHVHEESDAGVEAKGDCSTENCECSSSTVILRSEAVRDAAQAFINGFVDEKATRMVSIVEFGGYKTNNSDAFIAGATTVTSADKEWMSASDLAKTEGNYCDALANYSYRYAGTNIEAGLLLAENLLEAPAVKDLKNKNVILLSDGAPTYHVVDSYEGDTSLKTIASTSAAVQGNGSAMQYCAQHNDPAEVAGRMRTAGITTYAAYVGSEVLKCERCSAVDNMSGQEWLQNECGFTTYSAETAEDIADIFAALVKIIEMKAKAWETTDPMGENIVFNKFNQTANPANEFVETDGTIKWDIKTGSIPKIETEDGVTTYTYTLTYQITLDTMAEGYQANTEYATNGVTGLTYVVENSNSETGQTTYKDGTAYFNIPSVKGYEAAKLNFNNAKLGETAIGSGSYKELAGATFQIAHSENCPCSSETEWGPLTAISDENGSFGFEGIPSGHTYVMTETAAPEGYAVAEGSYVFKVSKGKVVEVSNTLINEKGQIINDSTNYNIPVKKVWNDDENRDGLRPASITAGLYEAGSETALETAELNEENGWKATFTEVPKFDKDGTVIEYEVKEAGVPDGYSSKVTGDAATGFAITNTHEVEKTSVKVTKKWADGNNQDGIRPAYATVQLYANGVAEGDPVTLNEDNNWTAEWTDLNANEAGKDIEYTVSELNVPAGYTPTVTGSEAGYTITNTHTPEVTSATVSKVWTDNDNQDGKRPESLKVTLSNGQEVVLSADNDWKATVGNLPKFADGKEIIYTWTEASVDGYELTGTAKDGLVTTLTNTHEIEKTSVEGSKTWSDNNDQDGKRPESITVNLLADGKEVAEAVVTAKDNWAWSFTDLDKYADGKEIKYTVTEDAVEGYTTTVNGNDITNTHDIELIDISGSKTWDDADNQDGKRPESIEVTLLADGEPVEGKTVTVTAADDWAWTFENLPKYAEGAQGVEVVYTVSEAAVEGYTTTVNGTDVTNSYTPGKVGVTVTKAWDDANDQDGVRPDSVTVELLADGQATGKTVELNAENQWTGSFEDLDEYAAGELIEYTVSEAAVEGYTTNIAANENGSGYTITNTHEVELTEVEGAKTWDDADDQDGVRPESIKVNLLADGEVIDTVTVTEKDGWAWSFTELPKYKDHGTEIVYTVTEEAVNGYEAAVNGFDITNTHEVELTEVEGTKTWNDANDQDGVRPESITVNLLADGEVIDTVTVTEKDGWAWSFTELPKYRDHGTEIVYEVAEDAVAKYEASVDGFDITNTHTPAVTEVEGAKTWNDNDDQDGVRPESIEVNLLADDEVIDTVTVTEKDDWAWSFTDLPKYNDGKEIVYTVAEAVVADGYEATVNGFDITNSYDPQTVVIEGTKTWDDADDQDGLRPDSVVVLIKDGEVVVDTQTATADTNWTYKSKELPKYENHGVEIEYTVEEKVVANGYEASVNGFDITNTHTPELTSVTGTKTWTDENDQDGKRPEAITVNLLADGKEIKDVVVTEADGWTWSFTELPKYRDGGIEILYTVTEDAVEDYVVNKSGANLINTHEPGKVSVQATKIWDDADNQDGKRPETITVQLYADGTAVEGKTLILSEANKWSAVFSDLDEYKAGQKVKYTVAEAAVPAGYTAAVTGDAKDGYVITNTHTPELISVEGNKVWNDNNDQDGVRPDEITIALHADGKEVDSQKITEKDNWAWSFTDVPKYANGEVITYTVTENLPEGYSSNIVGDVMTNSYTPEETSVSITKVWADNNDQDGLRPDEITATLTADGVKLFGVELNEANDWTASIGNLPKYRDGGIEIEYSFVENDVPAGYTVGAATGSMAEGFKLVNTHVTEQTKVEGSKTWNDANDQDGVRPDYITIKLLADGVEKESKVVTEKDGWAWSFTGLDKYRDHGTEIVYTIVEVVADDYSTDPDGFDVTNNYTPEETSVTVSKYWADADDQDGIRPGFIEVELYADGEATGNTLKLTEKTQWTATFDGLDKYRDHGVEIVYTVAEVGTPSGYEVSVDGSQKDGFVITNAHTPETTVVNGAKTWDDADNQDGKRPESITVELYADGKVVDSAEVTAADNWAWTFDNLPKYRDHGTEIVYTVDEVAVPEYEKVINGFNITNTHEPELTTLNGAKVWNDAENQDGKRPESITVSLLANGEVVDTVEVTEAEAWAWEFKDVPVYAAGQMIEYTVTEAEVAEYEAAPNGMDITNTHTPETRDIAGTKTWVDNDNEKGKRPESITVNLLANGEEVAEAVVTEAEEWTYEFTDLPVYKAGEVIEYTITEDPVPEYNTEIVEFNVINTLKAPAMITLEAGKVLEGAELQAGQFEFGLFDEEGNLIELATNDEEGYIPFTSFELDAVGTYTYFIGEAIPDGAEQIDDGLYYLDEIVYDASVFVYEVEIAEDENGDYAIANETLLKQSGETFVEADSIMFINIFAEEEETIEVLPPAEEIVEEEIEPADEGVQTGDDSNMAPFGLLALAALATAIMAFRRKKED